LSPEPFAVFLFAGAAESAVAGAEFCALAAAIAAAVVAAAVAASAGGADPVVVSGDAFGAGVAGAEFALPLSDTSGWVPAVAFAVAAAFAAATACLLPRATPAFAIAASPALGLVATALFAELPLAFPPVLFPAAPALP
jgi:hypothetical protein